MNTRGYGTVVGRMLRKAGLVLAIGVLVGAWVPARADEATGGMPTLPLQVVGHYAVPRVGAVAVAGGYTYLGIATHLAIVDVRDPAAPTSVGSLPLAEYVHDIQVADRYAYLANGLSGLKIVNVTDPVQPSLVGQYYTTNPAVGVAVVSAGATMYAYLATEFGGVQIVNVTDPAHPVLVGRYATVRSAEKVRVLGTHAYVAANDGGLVILDVANPALPVLRGGYDTPGTALDVVVSGTTAYIADGNAGVLALAVTNPATPTLLGAYRTATGAQGLRIAEAQVYVATVGSLLVLNTEPAAFMTRAAELTIDTASTLRQLRIAGDLIYLADGDSGLYLVRRAPDAFTTRIARLPLLGR